MSEELTAGTRCPICLMVIPPGVCHVCGQPVMPTRVREIMDQRDEEIEALRRERDEAREFGERAAKLYNDLQENQRILRCAFCDEEYPPGTPPTQHEALTAHVKVCARHPMREVEAKLQRAREALDEAEELRAQLAIAVEGLTEIARGSYPGASYLASVTLAKLGEAGHE